ncbi:MAG: phosphatidylserine decarboxylase [Saccharofermentanales bacterium]|jgi:phosphatidylserine decarboxylase
MSATTDREKNVQAAWSRRLYQTKIGRFFLRTVFLRRWFSQLGALYFDGAWSRRRIKHFITEYRIDLTQYEPARYRSFNDFFIRKLKSGQRPFESDPTAVISPADGLLSAVRLTDNATFLVKGQSYAVATLLGATDGEADFARHISVSDSSAIESGRNRRNVTSSAGNKLAERTELLRVAQRFANGLALIVRLRVQDYHRYMYMDSGTAGQLHRIAGKYHTVAPIGLEHTAVWQENCREWQSLYYDHIGEIIQVEVGAMLVGRIVNHATSTFARGDEKGYFCFGGSTIVLLIQEGQLQLSPKFETCFEEEIPVLQGETIGRAQRNP